MTKDNLGRHRAPVAQPVVHPWLRRVTAILSTFIMLATALGGGAVYALNSLNKDIKKIDITDLGARPSRTPTETSAMNFLIMGSDTRQGTGNTGYGDVSGARSDTTLLVHLYEGRKDALVLSIPRDSYVTIPVCKSTTGEKVGPWTTKFNAAFSIGGPVCTIKTIESVTGISVDSFVVLDFNAFKKVVDAIGGVEVCLTSPVYDPYIPGVGGTGLNLPAGWTTINGKQALKFVRARESIGDGSDIGRIRRQQEFTSSMIKSISESGTLKNPSALFKIFGAITSSLSTSPDLASVKALQDFALSLQDLKPSHIKFVTTPYKFIGDGNVHWIPETEELFQAIQNDQPWPPAPKPSSSASGDATATVTVAPSDIKVDVLNGSGITGQAKKVQGQLEAKGYTVGSIGNSGAQVTQDTIRYNPKQADAAQTLKTAIGNAIMIKDDTLGTSIELTVSKKWSGVKEVKITKPASVSPSAEPTPTDDPNVLNAAANVCSEGNNRTKQ